MIILVSCYLAFFLAAVIIISIPFYYDKQSLLSKSFISIIIFLIVSSSFLYLSFCHPKDLFQWLSKGERHYELAMQVERLGGLDGMIITLEERLEDHPEDEKALEILQKLQAIKRNSYAT